MIKSRILLIFTFALLCFVILTFNVFAIDEFPENYFDQGDCFVALNTYTSNDHVSYIMDLTVYNRSNCKNYVVFFVTDNNELHDKIYEYSVSGFQGTFCEYINFVPDYQAYSGIMISIGYSNFFTFSDFLNFTATNLINLSNSLDDFMVRYNALYNDYNTLFSQHSELLENFNSTEHDLTELQNQYKILNQAYQELQKQYNLYEESYHILGESYNSLSSEYDELLESKRQAILKLSEDNKKIMDEYSELVSKYEMLLKTAEQNYQIGYNDGLTEGDTFNEGLITIFSSPMYVFGEIFDFEIFGIDFINIIQFLITVSVVGFVISKIRV